MNPPIKLLVFILLLLPAILVRSQDPYFQELKQPDGQLFKWITGLTQDIKGNLWLSTDHSLIKYDGQKVTEFTQNINNPNTISGYKVESVMADRKGYIWIGTFHGLDRLDPVTGKIINYFYDEKDPKSLSGHLISAILEDKKGRIWVGTDNGLNLLDRKSETFTRYQHDPKNSKSISDNMVRALYEDRQGTIWVGCGATWSDSTIYRNGEGGLNRMDVQTGTFTRYMHDPKDPHTLSDNRIESIFEDSRGEFWIGTGLAGLHRMDRASGSMERIIRDAQNPGNPIILPTPPELPHIDVIASINEDATGALWICQNSHGPTRYDPVRHKVDHFDSETRAGGFTGGSTWRSYRTRDNVMWFGTLGATLFKMDPYISRFSRNFTDFYIQTMASGRNGAMIFGNNEGLHVVDKYGVLKKHFIHDPKKADYFSRNLLNAVLRDSKGRIWVSGPDDLNLFDEASGTFHHYRNNPADEHSFSGGYIESLMEDSKGLIWIGMHTGLDRFDPSTGQFTHFKNIPGDSTHLPKGTIWSLSESSDGHILAGIGEGSFESIGEGRGFCILDREGRVTRHALKGLVVGAIFRDHHGTFWFGTNQGLITSKDLLTFLPFAQKEMPDKSFFGFGFIEDRQGRLWFSSNHGMIYMLSEDRKQIRGFGHVFGVVPIGFNYGSSAIDSTGNIYFGGNSGYYQINSENISGNPMAPEVSIQYLQVDEGSKAVSTKKNIVLDTAANEVSLPYAQNNLTIGFSTIHFSSPEDNRQSYILEPYDREWRDAGNSSDVRYPRLPPGKYKFRLKGESSSGLASETSLSIIIDPPWWRSWWAYGLYALTAISLIVLVDRIQKQRLISKERERNRAREMAQAKEIEKAYHELKATQSQLVHAEKMASLGELTAGIAHEIQNPLNFINNFSEVNKEILDEFRSQHAGVKDAKGEEIVNDPLLKDIGENLQKVAHHGKRADTIVKSMLQHSRASTGQKEWTDLNALVDEHLRLSYHAVRATDPAFNPILNRELDPQVGEIEVVPQEIGRVILNLVNNAFFAVSERQKRGDENYQPQVTVSTKKLNGQVLITVADNGTGIPEKVLSKIFQPFFTTKPTGQGTGLGLSLSHDIVKAHGGKIDVHSEAGQGTEFIISLPA
jgi:signal transduction histidine kinase/ligand-binding sensor domain-containing protein